MKEAIVKLLSPGNPWAGQLNWLETTDSTNLQARLMAAQGAPHGTIVIAGHQTGGRGRMGRSFHSPKGMGVYLSVILRPQQPSDALMHLTCAAGKAMCDAVERVAGFRPGIKWTNDLVCQGRKLGGILVEAALSPKTGVPEALILGVGINISQTLQDFPEELQGFAGSLEMISKQKVDLFALAAAMTDALWEMDRTLFSGKAAMLDAYRADCVTLGQDVVLVRGDEKEYGKALDIDENGGLIVRFRDGQVKTVTSGEVSVRGIYGYL